MTHDHERNGTTALSAALDVPDGTVPGRCMRRHRHREFPRFLDAVEAAVPAGRLAHRVLDDHATREHPEVPARLARHPRRTSHSTPTSGSWPSAAGSFFPALTRRRRGAFGPIVGLRAAIDRYIDEHNDDPAPFAWTKTADRITAKLNRLNASVRHVPM